MGERRRRLLVDAIAAVLLIGCGGGGDGGTTPTPPIATPGPTGPTLGSIVVSPASSQVGARHQTTLAVSATDANGAPTTTNFTWSSSDTLVATVNSAGVVTGISAGQATITVSALGKSASAAMTVTPGALGIKGVWAMFERVGGQGGFWNGELLKQFDSVDATAGEKVSDAVAQQMDLMRGMGINAISFQVVGTDSTTFGDNKPPACYVPPLAGARWPNPTPLELTNLVKLLDLAQQNGIKVLLNLSHTHYEESPPANATTWLTAIINAVKNHPALELVTFMGDVHVNNFGTASCGLPAEPPLWLGPSNIVYQNLKAQMALARSLGLDPRKISAEAIVGDFAIESDAARFAGTSNTQHAYSPIQMLKQIFDELSWPADQRTYALSFYHRLKCAASGAPAGCVQASPDDWADQTMRFVSSTIGPASGGRAIAIEFGTFQDGASTPEQSAADLTTVMRKFGMDGGAWWIWVNTDNTYEASLPFADAIVKRGATIQYNPVKDAIAKAYSTP